MNMKTLTQFLILCAGITLTLNSCSKEYYQCEPLAEEDSRWPYNITAEWQQESVDFDFKITSAEDQTAAVLDKPSNDTITVTTSNGTNYLHYLWIIQNESDTLFISNQTVFDALDDVYPKYQSFIYLTEPLDGVVATCMIINSLSDSLMYEGIISDYEYSEGEYSINISNGILFNSDVATDSVIINGTIDMESYPLIANTAISVPMSFPQTTTNIVLNPNGEYLRSTIEMIGDTEFENIADGSWEVTDTIANIITIIETDEFEETDTLMINYSLVANTLTFVQEKDPCEGFTESECFEQFELNFGLADNSITELGLTSTMAFTKPTTGKRKQLTDKQPAYWFGKSTYFKDLYSKR